MKGGLLQVTKHYPRDVCGDFHCAIHHVDEVGAGYRRCFECGHLYRSKRELVRMYRREYLACVGSVPSTRWARWAPRTWWHILTIKADKIRFCQVCVHDF